MEQSESELRARVRSAVSQGLKAHLLPLLLLAALLLAAMLLLDDRDERLSRDIGWLLDNLLGLLPLFLAGLGAMGMIWRMLPQWSGNPLLNTLRQVINGTWMEILLLRVPLAICLALAISYLYFTFKVNIPKFAPLTWDHFFAGIDRALFLGHDPWVLSHQLFPGVRSTLFFDALYLIWYLILFTSILCVAILPSRHPLRLSFLLALGLNWVIGGVILAIMFPAAGPVYMERIIGDPMFQPLMERLYQQAQESRIMALEIQEWLWDGYTLDEVDPAGISAFPSVHLSIAATCTCLGFAVNRVLGWELVAFTVGILAGSVHLGWHYAVDDFAGILLGILFWWISARLTRWWLARTEPEPAGEEIITSR
jgi:hypothetical protein